jgi:hypothetical protein
VCDSVIPTRLSVRKTSLPGVETLGYDMPSRKAGLECRGSGAMDVHAADKPCANIESLESARVAALDGG